MKILSQSSIRIPEFELQCSVIENTYADSELSGTYYGLRLCKLVNSVQLDSAEIIDISTNKDFVFSLKDLLIDNTVTPVTFKDVVEDIVSQK